MPVSTAPSVEALSEIVTRINTAVTYTLPQAATRVDVIDDDIADLSTLKVEVFQEEEEQLDDTLATEDRSSHQIRIVMRKKVTHGDQSELDALRLLARQIWQRVNEHRSSNQRVCVWEADFDPKEVPIRSVLRESSVFQTSILLRVEVAAS